MDCRVIIFVLFVSSFSLGNALICYKCTASSSNSACNLQGSETCNGTCITTVGSVLGYSSYTKSCITTPCTPTNLNLYVSNSKVSCCTTDLCNVSGSPRRVASIIVATAMALISSAVGF
ncbi:prostate stem cell antigen-like [Lethenteron reissneri]|uniref:prostate stem cell antigen-like n=1 Tax=Lethenteron reissneri TaxID=7753 RepID=UPI002AB61DE9|nr:prostate stem cell antigen-like [Lethenteron reissneri]